MIGYTNDIRVVGIVDDIRRKGNGINRLTVHTRRPDGSNVRLKLSRKGDLPEFLEISQTVLIEGYVDQFLYVNENGSKKSDQRFVAEKITLAPTRCAKEFDGECEGYYSAPLSVRCRLAGRISYKKKDGAWTRYMLKTKVDGKSKVIALSYEQTDNKPADFDFEIGDCIACVCAIESKRDKRDKKTEYSDVLILDAAKIDDALFE